MLLLAVILHSTVAYKTNPLISFPAPELEISRVSGAVPCLLPCAMAGGDTGQKVPELLGWARGGLGVCASWSPYACTLEMEQGCGMRFCPRQGTQAVGAGGVQCPPAQFATSAPKISLPCAHILLSLTPTRSSGSDGDSDVDSELEERVDGVKSWLSKNKGSSKALSDDGSLKGSRWVQGWVAEDRVSCARGWTRYGGSTHGMSHSGCCACVAGQGRVNVMTSSVSTGDTSPHPKGPPWSPSPSFRLLHHCGGTWPSQPQARLRPQHSQ